MELGIYSFFASVDVVTLLAVFLLASIGVIQLMRKVFEGSQYDVAWSATLGGLLIALVTLKAILIIQIGVIIPSWMGNDFQEFVLVASLACGVAWLITDWKTQWADRYHHIVVFPIQIFLLGTLLPIIFTCGTKDDQRIGWTLICAFLILFAIDVIFGNLAQRRKLIETLGARFKNETKEEGFIFWHRN